MRKGILVGVLFFALLVGGCFGGDDTLSFTLQVEVKGEGTVSPAEGLYRYNQDTLVTLTALPEEGWAFVGWEGIVEDKSSAQTQVIVDRDKTVKAVFNDLESDPFWVWKRISAGGADFYIRKVPAATFPMGVHDEKTATVESPFWIAETEVTYALWYTVRQWALHNGYVFVHAGREGSLGTCGQAPTRNSDHPVTMVSFRDGLVWTNALSEMLGYEPVYTHEGSVIRNATDYTACNQAVQEHANGFRLPTTQEWELAARYRGSDDSHGAIFKDDLYWTPGSYASGATEDVQNAAATQQVGWYDANSRGSAKKVGTRQANDLGLYDMSGNVWEWCFTPGAHFQIARGGGWNINHFYLRVGSEVGFNAGGVGNHLGFRLAKTQL